METYYHFLESNERICFTMTINQERGCNWAGKGDANPKK